MDLSFRIADGPHQCSHSRVRVPMDSWPYCTVSDSRLLEVQVPIFISPRKRVPSYAPKHWVPFSSPPTTHKTTVEVLDPAYTRLWTFFSRWFSLYNLGTSSIEDTATALPLFQCAYPLPRWQVYRPLSSNNRFFWFHYSGLSAAMLPYHTAHISSCI
jgi:hypothetical protein